MGHKVPAKANRLGVRVKREKDPELRMVAEYDSGWFSEIGAFRNNLEEDWQVRQLIEKKYGRKSGISKVKVNRKSDKLQVEIHSIRPANVLGRDNQQLEVLREDLQQLTKSVVRVDVVESSFTDPNVIAERIALDLERRAAFRKTCKTAISKAMSNPEVLGLKVAVSGRLSGEEIARTEWYLEGTVPLHTLHCNIENGFAEADTTYGKIGVKVIIHRTVQQKNQPNTAHRQHRNR